MSCSGCNKSCKISSSERSLARKIKGVEPSDLDRCLECKCDKCTGECTLTIKADQVVVNNDLIVDGEINGNVRGTLVGNVCLGLLKSSVQLVCNPDASTPFGITSNDLVTQIRTDTATTYDASLDTAGSEGQFKIIHLYPTVTGSVTVNIDTGVETVVLTSPMGSDTTTPTSVQLYFIGGAWYPYQLINGTIM